MSEGTPVAGARAVAWRGGRAREARARDVITFDVVTGELSGALGLAGAGKTTIQILGALLGATPEQSVGAPSRRRPSRGRR